MNDSISEKMDRIHQKLVSGDFLDETADDDEFFGGADVIISDELRSNHQRFISDQPQVFPMSDSEYIPRRRVVITRHAAVLSALFFAFRDSSGDLITAANKHEFYGTLAQSSIDFIEAHGDPVDATDLLREVYQNGRTLLEQYE